jgi:hypothetical protein
MLCLHDSSESNGHLWRSFWLFELSVFVVVGVICWLLGVRTLADYGIGLVIGGFVLIISAGAAQSDIPTRISSTAYQFGLPTIDHTFPERVKNQVSTHRWELSDFMYDVLVGIVPLGVGLALYIIF